MSYNRPRFSACASWDPNAITLADSSTLVSSPSGLFVNTNNTVYATTFGLHSVLVWPDGSANATQSIFTNLNIPYSIFVTSNGDVYADNGYSNRRVEKWTATANTTSVAMSTSGLCGGLFVDIYDSLYCSLPDFHEVLKKSIDNHVNTSVAIAGNGTYGSAPDLLYAPHGIFVDTDLSFYVADYGNDRVQLFQPGQSNGTTVAGTGASDTITLALPTGVALDGDGFLFIVDQAHFRIVGSGPNGFRCIAGCSGKNGSAANELFWPLSLSFDSYGHLYVTDLFNNRIQKFMLARNACGECFLSLFSVNGIDLLLCAFSYALLSNAHHS